MIRIESTPPHPARPPVARPHHATGHPASLATRPQPEDGDLPPEDLPFHQPPPMPWPRVFPGL